MGERSPFNQNATDSTGDAVIGACFSGFRNGSSVRPNSTISPRYTSASVCEDACHPLHVVRHDDDGELVLELVDLFLDAPSRNPINYY
jgi:hypothetical protein